MPDWGFQLLTLVGGCFTAYSAIRADLARVVEKAQMAHETASEAHKRIDEHIDRHHIK